MIRSFKSFGLALVAVLGMSAIVASGAQAANAQLTAASSPAVMDGTQTEQQVLNRLGRKVFCETATFSATATSGSTEITVTPTYSGCSTSLGGPATVTMNGCDYLFHLTADASDNYSADADLKCSAGSHVVIDAYLSHTAHTNGEIACQYTFNETGNQGLTSINLTNGTGASDDITADINISGIDSKRTIGGTLLCGGENDTNASLTGGATLTGTTETGGENGITISTD